MWPVARVKLSTGFSKDLPTAQPVFVPLKANNAPICTYLVFKGI